MFMNYPEFLKNAIIEAITKTTDEKILQYIYTLLMAAMVEEKRQANS